MSTRYVSFERIAESKGCEVEAVREAATKGDFGSALSKDGKRINAFHSKAKAWLGGEYIPRVKPGRPYQGLETEDAPIFSVEDPATIQRIADAVIALTEHGTPKQVHAWSRMRKEIAAAAAAEAKRDQVDGQLVPKALVERAAVGYLDALLRGLHGGTVAAIAQRLSGDDRGRRVVGDLVGAVLEKAREDVVRLVGGGNEGLG